MPSLRVPQLQSKLMAAGGFANVNGAVHPVLMVRDGNGKMTQVRGASFQMSDVTPPGVSGYAVEQVAGTYTFRPSAGFAFDNASGALDVYHLLSDAPLELTRAVALLADAANAPYVGHHALTDYAADAHLALTGVSALTVSSYCSVSAGGAVTWRAVAQDSLSLVPTLLLRDHFKRYSVATLPLRRAVDYTSPFGVTGGADGVSAVSALAMAAGADGFSVTFSGLATVVDAGSAVASIKVLVGTTSNVAAATETAVAAGASSKTVSGLANLTTYYGWVKATDGFGNVSVTPAPMAATTPDTTPPVMPGALAVAPKAATGSHQLLVSGLDLIADNGGAPGLTVEVLYGVTGADAGARVTAAVPSGTAALTLPGLVAGTAYDVLVKAHDAAGNIAVVTLHATTRSIPALAAPLPASAITETAVTLGLSLADNTFSLTGVSATIGFYSAARSDMTAATLVAEATAGAGASFVSSRTVSGVESPSALEYVWSLAALRAYTVYFVTFDAMGNRSALAQQSVSTVDTSAPAFGGAALAVAQGASNYTFSVSSASTVSDNVPGALRGYLLLSTAGYSAAAALPAGLTAAALDAGLDAGAKYYDAAYSSGAVSLATLSTSKYYDAVAGAFADIAETHPASPFALFPHLVSSDASGNRVLEQAAAVTVSVHDWTPAAVGPVAVTQGAGAENYTFTVSNSDCTVADGRAGALTAVLVLGDRVMNADELKAAYDSAVAAATFPAGAKYYDAAYAGGSAQVALSGALATARYYRNLSAPYGWAAVDDATAAQSLYPHVLAIDPSGNTAKSAPDAAVVAVADRSAPALTGTLAAAQTADAYSFALSGLSATERRTGAVAAAVFLSKAALTDAQAIAVVAADSANLVKAAVANPAPGSAAVVPSMTTSGLMYDSAGSVWTAVDDAVNSLYAYLVVADAAGNSRVASIAPTVVDVTPPAASGGFTVTQSTTDYAVDFNV